MFTFTRELYFFFKQNTTTPRLCILALQQSALAALRQVCNKVEAEGHLGSFLNMYLALAIVWLPVCLFTMLLSVLMSLLQLFPCTSWEFVVCYNHKLLLQMSGLLAFLAVFMSSDLHFSGQSSGILCHSQVAYPAELEQTCMIICE